MISTIAKQTTVVAIAGAVALGMSLTARAEDAKSTGPSTKSAAKATTPATKAPEKKPAATNAKLTVMEFNAVWCAPCKAFAPVYERVKTTFAGQAEFQSWDADSKEGEKLADKYKVSSLPTVLFLNDKGKVIFKHGGIMDEKTLSAELNKALGK